MDISVRVPEDIQGQTVMEQIIASTKAVQTMEHVIMTVMIITVFVILDF
jgi:hypothetical protein